MQQENTTAPVEGVDTLLSQKLKNPISHIVPGYAYPILVTPTFCDVDPQVYNWINSCTHPAQLATMFRFVSKTYREYDGTRFHLQRIIQLSYERRKAAGLYFVPYNGSLFFANTDGLKLYHNEQAAQIKSVALYRKCNLNTIVQLDDRTGMYIIKLLS